MTIASFTVNREYWEGFELQDDDVEFIYAHLLDLEIPLASEEILQALIDDRLTREREAVEKKNKGAGDIYLPKESYPVGAKVVFPALGYQAASVVDIRDGRSFDGSDFKVIEVELTSGEKREFATELGDHFLNEPPKIDDQDPMLTPDGVLGEFGSKLADVLVNSLKENDDFVYIAGRWFPQALLIDVNAGHLNLAEAILDMHEGGPQSTEELIAHVDLPKTDNPKLAIFSMDLALQEDNRFDEVGPVGEVAWYLKRLEPDDVQTAPLFLRYSAMDYDRDELDDAMLVLEKRIDDEHSLGVKQDLKDDEEVEVS